MMNRVLVVDYYIDRDKEIWNKYWGSLGIDNVVQGDRINNNLSGKCLLIIHDSTFPGNDLQSKIKKIISSAGTNPPYIMVVKENGMDENYPSPSVLVHYSSRNFQNSIDLSHLKQPLANLVNSLSKINTDDWNEPKDDRKKQREKAWNKFDEEKTQAKDEESTFVITFIILLRGFLITEKNHDQTVGKKPWWDTVLKDNKNDLINQIEFLHEIQCKKGTTKVDINKLKKQVISLNEIIMINQTDSKQDRMRELAKDILDNLSKLID